VDLMLRTLKELSDSLGKLNIPLLIRTAKVAGDVPSVVLDVAKSNQCDHVFFNKEYEVNESRRDAAVTKLLSHSGIKAAACTDQVLFEPGSVRTGEGRFYTVFTPFKKTYIRTIGEAGGIRLNPAPVAMPEMVAKPSPIPKTIEGVACDAGISAQWAGGESEAKKRLSKFARSHIGAYRAERDFPSLAGTSTLSPYLAIGAISPRRCFEAAIEANRNAQKPRELASPLDSGSEGITTWISELIWREFYIHVMTGFPRVCMHRAFQPATESIRWNVNDKHFDAWCRGETGVPIVDAGMRQLRATGWMHNRVRMIVAMYLSKNLFLDWRLGEKFFMQHLVDGFLASNNGGWQWSASTGTDAAPYFRIFNPVSQSERFDPEGKFIRMYIPELRSVGHESIHDPSAMPPLAKARLSYPEPLVNLSTTREAAIAAFKGIKG